MQLFADELTNQNREYYKVNGNNRYWYDRKKIPKQHIEHHKKSFSNRKYSAATALSKYIWVLMDANINFNYFIKWSIIKRARAYTSEAKHAM